MSEIKLSTGAVAQVKEMTGRDEALLKNRKGMMKGESIEKVMLNCVESLDGKKPNADDILDLLSIDRKMIVMEIRKQSYGKMVEMKLSCSDCGSKTNITFNLDLEDEDGNGDVKFTPPKTSEDGTMQDEFEVLLPKSNKKVKFVRLKGKHENKLLKLRNDDLYGTPVYVTITEIDGDPKNKKIYGDLPSSDLHFLRKKMKDVNAVLETSGETTCDDCNQQIIYDVAANVSFFFPPVD